MAEFNFDCDTNGAATTTFVPDSGNSRIIPVVLSHEQTQSTRPVATFTLGGVTMHKLSHVVYGQSTSYAYTEIWYCLENEISSLGSNPAVAITVTGAGNKFVSGTIFTVAAVDQDYTTWQTASNTQPCGTDLTATLSAGTLWPVIGGATSTIGGASFTTGSTVTEVTGSDRNFNVGPGGRAVAFSTTSPGSSVAITTASTSTNTAMSQSMLAVSFPVYENLMTQEITFSGVNTTDRSLAYSAPFTVVDGDKLTVPLIVSGSVLFVDPSGTFVFSPAVPNVTTFTRVLYDTSAGQSYTDTVTIYNSAELVTISSFMIRNAITDIVKNIIRDNTQ